MANQKIHEYPLERFVFGDEDYYDIDYWDGVEYKTAKILGSVIKSAMLSGIAISLTAPSAFIVGGSPTDGTGTLTLTAAGLANQYIRGDGTLATFPISGGGGNSVNYYLNGGTAASVATYYQMSKIPVIGTGVDFSLAGNGLISQWLTDLNDPNVTEIPAGNWNFEMFFSASSAGGVPKFYIEILKYDGTTFTTIANNSAAPESITSGTTIDLYLTSVAVPLTPLLVTDRLAIRVYIVDSTLGRTINQHTQDSHLCQIITTFSSGVSSINGLTKQTQYLAVGTAGTDFNIDSAIDTHTFNLPTASATKRGALSSLDWIAFNGKLSGLTIGTTPITSGTIGRILFEGTGNVVQESARMAFDGSKYVYDGTSVTANASTFEILGAGGQRGLWVFQDNSAKIGGNNNNFTTKGTGTGQSTNNFYSNDSHFCFGGVDSSKGWIHVGVNNLNPQARLDIRAQGALSTDIAFRVRNSADTLDIFKLQGNGAYIYRNNANNSFSTYDALGQWDYIGGGTTLSVAASLNSRIVADAGAATIRFGSATHSLVCYKAGNFQLEDNAIIQTSGQGGLSLKNGTNPSTSTVDRFNLYSADIVAGNAAPHFRTENGSVIKLYKQDLPTNPTNAEIATLLSNLGLANLI